MVSKLFSRCLNIFDGIQMFLARSYCVVYNCKIVLLTLVAPRGVTDLHLSWGIHIEHAQTAYHETCGTEYQQPYRRCNSTPYPNWNIAQARPMSVSDVSRSLQSWVSTTHRSYSQLTFFSIFIKSTSPWSRPHEVTQVTRNFGGVTTATYSYAIPVANLRLLKGETNL